MSGQQIAPYDLHLHSHWSYDASASPQAYFKRADELGLRCIALTEHHCIDSIAEALEIVQGYPNMRFVNAAEFTVTTSIGQVDLLCYDLPAEPPSMLQKVLDNYRQWQQSYDESFCATLRSFGCAYTYEDRLKLLKTYRPPHVIDKQGHTEMGTPLQDAYFVHRGFVRTLKEAEALRHRAADCTNYLVPPAVEDVVRAVHDAGALIAIAHPHGHFLGDNRARMDGLRKECHADGLECAHKDIPPEFTPIYRDYCLKHGLFCVAGSDCHHEINFDTIARHGGREQWLDEFLERLR